MGRTKSIVRRGTQNFVAKGPSNVVVTSGYCHANGVLGTTLSLDVASVVIRCAAGPRRFEQFVSAIYMVHSTRSYSPPCSYSSYSSSRANSATTPLRDW